MTSAANPTTGPPGSARAIHRNGRPRWRTGTPPVGKTDAWSAWHCASATRSEPTGSTSEDSSIPTSVARLPNADVDAAEPRGEAGIARADLDHVLAAGDGDVGAVGGLEGRERDAAVDDHVERGARGKAARFDLDRECVRGAAPRRDEHGSVLGLHDDDARLLVRERRAPRDARREEPGEAVDVG